MIPLIRAALAFILLATPAMAQVATAPTPSSVPSMTVNNLQLNPSQLASGDGWYNPGATHRLYSSINGASNGCYFDSAGLEACPLAGGTLNKWTLTAPATGITLTGTDGQTYTLPTTTASLARTDAAQSFTGLQTIAALTVGYITMNTNSVAIGKSAAPTACTVSGVTLCTVTKNAGTFGFKYTLTTGTPSGNTVTLALTGASDGYICDGVDISTGLRLQETTDSTTAPVLTAYNLAGAATNFSAGDALLIKCIGY